MTLSLSFARLRVCLCLALSLAMLPAASAQAQVQLLVSIRPLGLIAEEVAGERAKVTQLVPASASPHDYPLKASDMRLIQSADLVVWVGAEFESFLQKPLRGLSEQRQMELQRLEGLTWPASSGGTGHHPAPGEQPRQARDFHLWLDPHNARVVAEALASSLTAIDPQGAAAYRANSRRFVEELETLDRQLRQRMAPVVDVGFAVYHEGYGHFVARYGLRQLAHITYTPERRPGARHLHRLRQQLDTEAVCLFAEPYYGMRLARDLAEELNLRVGTLDPLGSQGVNSYRQLLENLARDLLACLAGENVVGH